MKGDINVSLIEYIEEAISLLYLKGSPDITILITSGGGSVDVSLDIIDILSLYPGKKTAIVLGQAASMAAVILQVCDVRKATTYAGILIHHINRRQVGLDTLRDQKKRDDLLNGMEKNQDKIYKILSERTKRSVQEIRVECEKERHMSVEEAKEFGLIDEVHQGPLPK